MTHYGKTRVSELGPEKRKKVLQAMVDGGIVRTSTVCYFRTLNLIHLPTKAEVQRLFRCLVHGELALQPDQH